VARASPSNRTHEPTNTLKTLPKHHANHCTTPDYATSAWDCYCNPLPRIALRQSVRVIVRHARSLKPDRRRAQRVEQLDISRAERTWQLNHQKGCSLRTAPLWGIRAIPLPLPCPRLAIIIDLLPIFTVSRPELATFPRLAPAGLRPFNVPTYPLASHVLLPCRLSSLSLRRAVGNDPSLLVN
jgi:hypothetical protein